MSAVSLHFTDTTFLPKIVHSPKLTPTHTHTHTHTQRNGHPRYEYAAPQAKLSRMWRYRMSLTDNIRRFLLPVEEIKDGLGMD